MLFHLQPTLLLLVPDETVALIDLTIAPYGLHLSGRTDLATRRPYGNKGLWVACRRRGQLAVDGLLIDGPRIAELGITARWAVGAARVLTHTARLTILDAEHDTVSTNRSLLHAMHPSLGGWGNRFPNPARLGPELATAADGDLMMLSHPHPEITPEDDRIEQGWLVERRQHLARPTIERGRLVSLDHGRMPKEVDAFAARLPSDPA